jgi:acyl carrier protein
MADVFDTEFDAVAAALRRLCQDPLPDLAADSFLDELPRMDSLRVLHVIAMLEDEYGVEIDVAALDGLRQVGDILRALRTARGGPGLD